MREVLPADPIHARTHHLFAFPGILTAVIVSGVLLALYVGREVLIPISLAGLMSFILAPAIRLFQKWRLPHTLAVAIVVPFAFAIVFAIGVLVISQVNQFANELPRYQATLRERIQALRNMTSGMGALERASTVLQGLSGELAKEPDSIVPATPLEKQKTPSVPLPVQIKQPDLSALQVLTALVTPLIHPLATTGIVFIFVFFILLQKQELRNRIIRLAGPHDIQRTTAAIDDAAQRLSRLFLAQLTVNIGFGFVIGGGLWLIGVPSPALWGTLAAVLRFVPYIGAPIAAAFPLALAAAVGPSWTMVLLTAVLFLTAEPLTGYFVEPFLYGHNTGLSPIAVIASATLWAWLWGPIGLILATPLTVCLVVLGRHVDRLKFVEVLFGDQPALTPAQMAYQRMLAGDPIELAEQARECLKTRNLVSYYEEILMEGLTLAQADLDRGRLDAERTLRIRSAVAELVDDLSSHKDVLPSTDTVASIDPLKVRTSKSNPIICIPNFGALDETIAVIVAQLIGREGIAARPESADALSMSRIQDLDLKDVSLVCLCSLGHATAAQLSYSVRRLRRKAPAVRLVVSVVGQNEHTRNAEPDVPESVDLVTHSLGETVRQVGVLIRATSDNELQQDRPQGRID